MKKEEAALKISDVVKKINTYRELQDIINGLKAAVSTMDETESTDMISITLDGFWVGNNVKTKSIHLSPAITGFIHGDLKALLIRSIERTREIQDNLTLEE